MKLQDKLRTMKTSLESNIPSRVLEVMHRATDDLANSGILEKALKVGDRMPDFALPDSNGTKVRLSAALANGPLVLTFFRGQW
ncbi:hypothetical protein BerOc1_03697 [Pseudodesulfovibrio hydrargyri]|uniref:Uncharacterized protein n=1 Tax=Pseudodesulfovibrio hydrargyri TaxID=2125990 RepID=A0A1J5MQP7_9BACT|nr:redoxin domain-containing protein [Pseudodesulfovibrio hydrargyri]OIQ48941.1 hypothetical protein BerOc1_03697 [Pseudodesulfovibrio hydrargyri]